MTGRSETLLKAQVSILLESIWVTEFYNDAEDHIQYQNPITKQNPRPEEDITKIVSELQSLKNDILDEIVDDLIRNNIRTFEDISNNYTNVRDICHKRFATYRKELWNVVKTEFPTRRVRNRAES
jgi:hypothetical protein